MSNCSVLWFEPSNAYVAISNILMDMVDIYLASNSKKDFLKELKRDSDIPPQQAEAYYNEISELLISSNSSSTSDIQKPEIPSIPNDGLEMIYNFSTKTVKITFGSEHIKDLIHPQWAHAKVGHNNAITSSFHIFKNEDVLYLFKDQTYIGHYPASDYHLLQGQFAVELINIFYNKKESDWMATFHASTVCNDNEAIMIIGDSGNGKSTLSAVLMANGMDVLADDFTPLSATNSEVYRFPSGISVKEGAFEILGAMYPDFEKFPTHKSTSKHVNIKYIPPIKSFNTAVSHVPCKKIVYVKYDAQATSQLKEVAIENILPTLIPESWLSPLASNAQLFLDWLKDVQCFELCYSDNDYAVAQLRKLLHSI
ncbi:hypothetical protein [Gelidibacter sp.]|uniref:hypothetical protein n=1 Tax=Gelidibacter sp. TaxID=2018083 RepID=UPI00326564A6